MLYIKKKLDIFIPADLIVNKKTKLSILVLKGLSQIRVNFRPRTVIYVGNDIFFTFTKIG